MENIFKVLFSVLIAFTSFNMLAYCYKSTQTNFLYLPINWTEVARVRSVSKNDLILSSDDFKSSACDVTAHSCDVYCCNDSDCSPEQIQIFHCLDMQPETEVTMHLKSLDCHLRSYWTPNWFPLLCYVKNNSAVLGFNYNDIKILDSQVDFLKIVDQQRFYTFAHPHTQEISSSINIDRSYTYGSRIQVFSEHLKEVSLFELPYPAISGLSCTTSRPVQFLLNSSWKCKQSITAQDCDSSSSPYNLMNFVISGKNDSLWQLANIFPPKLMKNLKDKSIGEVFVKNICLHSGSDFGWITKRIFNLEEIKVPLPQTEEYIVECGEFLELLKTSYDANNALCQNVLVGAEFIFEWSGSEIVRLNATYVLTDIAVSHSNSLNKGRTYYHSHREFLMKRKNLERNKAYVTQIFNVGYIPQGKEMKKFSPSQENASLKSGNPGYLIGKPLISGNLRLKPFKKEFNSSLGDRDILWQPSQMSLWRSD
ncbi:hypothetical protein J437_LFUL005472 [Ladona fulva]|uniref:Tectonic domain-containing protein n=1 Tax=Ladona fulva TaxID=123851 RepID=A0A8K0JXD4_LADFU|nr:hypothetical protein J437_LFUL005472 [Ladona fulva]